MVNCHRSVSKWQHTLAAAPMLAVILLANGAAVAETLSDCLATRVDERRTARAAFDRDAAACQGTPQCLKNARAKWDQAAKQIDSSASGCRARVQTQTAQPPIHWKPGDPAPVAPDGRRYIMSCNGKVLGLYKPGGAVEMELKSHPGNCSPNDDPWPKPGVGAPGSGASYCYERGTGSYKEYSGGKPSWCDPNR